MRRHAMTRNPNTIRRSWPGRFGRPLWLLAALVATACTVAPPPDTPVSPRVDLVVGDTRATQYGSTATEILANAAVRDKAPRLFGQDWAGGPGAKVPTPAAQYFGGSTAPRVLRIGGAEYIASPGCVLNACQSRRGLLLTRVDGNLLFARIDEGGLSNYYAHGLSLDTPAKTQALIDAAWRTVTPLR